MTVHWSYHREREYLKKKTYVKVSVGSVEADTGHASIEQLLKFLNGICLWANGTDNTGLRAKTSRLNGKVTFR